MFPHSRSIEAGDLEEERRLAYVGITRAKRELYLTYARTRALFGNRDWNLRSRFIDEIPIELTDREEQGPVGREAASTWGGGATAAAAPPEPSGPGAIFAPGRRRHARAVRRGRRDRAWSRAGSSSCASPATARSAS